MTPTPVPSHPSSITYDRRTGRIAGADARERLLMRLFETAGSISLRWTHRGYGLGCRLLSPVVPERSVDVRLTDDAVFRFPLGDPYWSTILDRGYVYEKDIDVFFRRIVGVDYTLLDCGANYGYWSVLASSAEFGGHPAVAVEPSSGNFRRLADNIVLNHGRFTSLQRAIGATDGLATLSGHKHESLSIQGSGAGEMVVVSSLDSLAGELGLFGRRCVVKLDVEGVEIGAIDGGARLLAGDCVVICEDHGNDPTHAVSTHILKHTPMKLFCYDPEIGRYRRLLGTGPLDRIKKASNRGYNVLATASDFWAARILA